MTILSDHVAEYLSSLRPAGGAVMAEMEALAERDSVPVVHWETGRLLAALCRALDPVVLEVGTAIGYSTLHMAEQLERGRVVTLEINPDRAAQARDFLTRAGVLQRVELIEGDARETIPSLLAARLRTVPVAVRSVGAIVAIAAAWARGLPPRDVKSPPM